MFMVPAQRRDRLRRALPPDLKITNDSGFLSFALRPCTCSATAVGVLAGVGRSAISGAVGIPVLASSARISHVTRASMVVGAQVPPVPTGGEVEVA